MLFLPTKLRILTSTKFMLRKSLRGDFLSIIAKQRPGVYSDYQTSGILYSKKEEKVSQSLLNLALKQIKFTVFKNCPTHKRSSATAALCTLCAKLFSRMAQATSWLFLSGTLIKIIPQPLKFWKKPTT